MYTLIPVETENDIPKQYQKTPIGLLLAYHNCDKPFDTYTGAKLLVGMCMDHRKHLTMPNNFAYIIRSGGANLRYSEFKVSYAISVGNVRHIALIGHNNCGMVNLMGRKKEFIEGLTSNAGWSEHDAEEHFHHYAPMFEIGNEESFIVSETHRLRERYPLVQVAPMMYNVEDNRLYIIKE
ncbi:MAG: carbonic anhydrase [Candidatus Peregrinibacteria bacterium]|nr:carbonic anhydrase [Candidatus Peregrinibacteria bacterium]MCB9808046.1 carbonic anhydrase [Candidatus Peribacteria bacterium]